MSERGCLTPAVSIIVPVYNMERLMRRCLDSIAGQTWHDYECILVDDGSKDSSGKICDEYAEKYAHFSVIHKVNGGLSSARNAGLNVAKGDYTIFVDPDDWIDKDGIGAMIKEAQKEKADMLICDAWIDSDVKHARAVQRPSHPEDHWTVMREIIEGPLQGWTWNKLIRREVYERRHIRYPEGIYACEDQYTMCELLTEPLHVAYLPEAYYHYMQYPGTLSRHYDQKTLDNDIRARDGMTTLLKGTPNEQVVRRQKTVDMVCRAFQYGQHYYSSSSFKQHFAEYEALIPGTDIFHRLVKSSCRGRYRFNIALFNFLLKGKQVINRLSNH